jgi:predicted phosphodiesterase
MKIAVFADVHGNLPALNCFLDFVRNKVDGYLCLGDVVDYAPWNDECLEKIYNLPNLSYIQGNHERLFLGEENLEHEVDLVKKFYLASNLHFTRIDLISNLPLSKEIGLFTAVHTIDNQSIYPDSIINFDKNYFIGHSHHQFSIEKNGFRLVNPGSVGQNRGFINLVEFAIYDIDKNTILFNKLRYEVDSVIRKMEELNYPFECIQYYKNKKIWEFDDLIHINSEL